MCGGGDGGGGGGGVGGGREGGEGGSREGGEGGVGWPLRDRGVPEEGGEGAGDVGGQGDINVIQSGQRGFWDSRQVPGIFWKNNTEA